jgi:rhodanese-related sulfurtransferase
MSEAAATNEMELAPGRAAELAQEAQVVDVRGADEHEAGHIPGDRLIPFDQLQGEAGTLDRERPLLLYCRGGDRSQVAAQALRASGFDAYTIDGGLLAWAEQGLPLEPEGAEVVERNVLPPA